MNSCNVCKEYCTYHSNKYRPKADNYYFNVINWGSLNYSSDYVMYILIVAFKVFKVILSERYGSEILARKKNKLVLRSTILDFFVDL